MEEPGDTLSAAQAQNALTKGLAARDSLASGDPAPASLAPSTLVRELGLWILRASLELPDRPGMLAGVAGLMAERGVNILRLHYDRSRDPNRVELVLSCPSARIAGEALDALAARGFLDPLPDTAEDSLSVIDMAGVLRFKIALKDRPGSLAALTARFAGHGANILHMHYDTSEAPGLAEAAVATSGADEVTALLGEFTRAGYHYHVLWQGGRNTAVDAALGLSEVEAFLFKLRSALPPDRVSALEELFTSSRAMRQALGDFKRASGVSGETLAASEVFANILRMAVQALGSTGSRFAMRLTGPVRLSGRVSLYMLTCPVGANSYLLSLGGELVFLDTNYGVYYQDVLAWLGAHGFDPARITRVLATHPDDDHAGWAGRLQAQFGAKVTMHPDSLAVFEHEDRSHGSATPLSGINHAFTRLIHRVSDFIPPEAIEPFESATGEWGGFSVAGKVTLGDLEFLALESLGGHASAQVFFLEPERAILFTGDYLLDPASLSPKDREALSVHKSLLTSTNTDSQVFVKEMEMLKTLMRQLAAEARAKGDRAMIFPGHGGFYAVEEADWSGE